MRDALLRPHPPDQRMGTRHPLARRPDLQLQRRTALQTRPPDQARPRWSITQNPDATRTWTTPAGLTYTKPRKQYPT